MRKELKEKMVMAKALLDATLELLWDDATELNGIKKEDDMWAKDVFEKLVDAKNILDILDYKDPDFMDGERVMKEQIMETVRENLHYW